MRDPFFWSIPLGRLFGVTIRVHLLYPIVAIGLILRVGFQQQPPYPDGTWIDASMIAVLLLFSVICHEFGHCFAARWVGGDASEVLVWPLGGLASVDVPHTPRAHFLTAAAGPFVNLMLCFLCAILLAVVCDPSYQPPWNPFWYPFRVMDGGWKAPIKLFTWAGNPELTSAWLPVVLARLFYLNWFLFLLNVLLVGFPLDGGRMLQAGLWPYLGYRSSMLTAIYAGFGVMVLVGIFSILWNEILVLCLAILIYVSCRHQLIMLETGGEDGLFGYDFSQGYTSLERDQPAPAPPPRRRISWWQRWLQRRAARKLLQQQQTREAEERRLDELLEKVQRYGKTALTDEELRFMKRVSDRYRNKK
jgi:stage IV sporulation protein FB